jgi:hypothetical protein
MESEMHRYHRLSESDVYAALTTLWETMPRAFPSATADQLDLMVWEIIGAMFIGLPLKRLRTLNALAKAMCLAQARSDRIRGVLAEGGRQ